MARLKIHGIEVESINSGGGTTPIPKDTTVPAFENISFVGLTLGSVLFVGANGALTEDNTKLFWDDTNNRLGVGLNNPSVSFQTAGDIKAAGVGTNNSSFSDTDSHSIENVGNGGWRFRNAWNNNNNAGFQFLCGNGSGVAVRMNLNGGGQLVIGGSTPDASAQLDIQSTTLGFLPPRMTTTQKNAIATPLEGLVVYDSTLHKLSLRTASAWETITSV